MRPTQIWPAQGRGGRWHPECEHWICWGRLALDSVGTTGLRKGNWISFKCSRNSVEAVDDIVWFTSFKISASCQWRRRECTCGHGGWRGRRGWDGWREWHGNVYITRCKLDSQWEFAIWCRELKPGLWPTWGVGERFKREGPYVYLWLVHIDVWQKPTQYCKAIILQFKINF